MTTEPCDFNRLPHKEWTWLPVKTGAKRRKVRCPRCGKRLRLETVPDRQDGGVAFYRIPKHRTTAKRLGVQLRLPRMKLRPKRQFKVQYRTRLGWMKLYVYSSSSDYAEIEAKMRVDNAVEWLPPEEV